MSRLEIDRLLQTAFRHHQASQEAQAEAIYRQILSLSPEHDGALHLLGILALQNNRPDVAVEYLRRASLIQPNNPAYHGNLGNALMGQGKVDEAVACFCRAVELKPDFAEAHNALGNALMRQRRHEEAIASYQRALALKPNQAETLNNLGNALKAQENLDDAVACYRRALQLRPDAAEMHNNLGHVLKSQGKLTEAVACYRQALALKPGFAETHNSLGIVLKEQGESDEAISYYRRAVELNPSYAEAHNNLGDALKGQGKLEEAVACIRRALELKPEYAELHNNLGNALKDQGKLEDAVACYRRALELKPHDAEAHNNLGIALKSQGKLDSAIACYRRALEIEADVAEPHNNLGNALKEKGNLDEAIACYRRALALKPHYVAAHRNLGIALRDQLKLDEAENHLNEAIRLRPTDDEAYLSRAMLWLLRGDFARGWEEYEWRWKTKKYALRRRADAQPRWDGSPLQGRTILLSAEQGLGDTLHFIRYAGMVAQSGGRVIVECQPPLKRLLQNSLGEIPVIDYNDPLPPFDVQCPLLSLPIACRTTMQNIPCQVPYVQADAESIAQWRAKLADDAGLLKVGLAWAGNKDQINDYNRSTTLATLAPLGDVPGVRWIGLQKGDAAHQMRPTNSRLALVDWTDELNDLADTAALVANLDLVITVDTSIAHLAGAMGRPVWTMLSFAADWRYLLEQEDSPWYPTMRLFRQRALGNWPSVVERVAEALRRCAEK